MAKINLINSRLTSVSASRNPEFSGEISMKTNIKIKEIKPLKNRKDTLQIDYFFEINYADLGKVSLEGILYIQTDPKTSKEIQKSWKDKQIDNPNYNAITNLILQKSSVKAFELEEELNLPIHIRLPTINLKQE